ncbi:hypothetical protein AB5N19_12260 [Seiridium cardinale]
MSDFTSASSTTQDVHEKEASGDSPEARIEDDVAIVGMSIKVAGADDVDEFWNLLCEGLSQHKEVPSDRLSFDNVWRDKESSPDPTRKWHMLQIAYQAGEQSGYFGVVGGKDKKKVGCFIGVCSADYENNVACYQPNAFTAIGNLKSFIAGKISHWFGWLGPSLCIDTACSSSLVAVHQACRAVLSGDCASALAGGANIMTNSLWFQNLAAASFLSPMGQCKPFDAFADGYCRGEGFAAVSDPAEYESIKNVLGPVTGRLSPLALGSVKGSVGHTDCASGAISLIKTLLMIQHKMIPPQASYRTLNPAVHASAGDRIAHQQLRRIWLQRFHGGDRGAKDEPGEDQQQTQQRGTLIPYGDIETTPLSADISFNLSGQANPTLDKSLVFSYRTVDQFVQKLDAFGKGVANSKTVLVSASARPPRPVIVCFGGQVSTFVGLDQAVYDSSKVLRMHLGRCNTVCETMPDAGSIFPSIFQRTPISDPVMLQASLFAMQYASAQSWIDSGVVPTAVVGHSFRELVAMCISGVFTLHDALKLVIRRATLVRESWAAEKETMMAIEADLDVVNKVLAAAGGTAIIAFFNGLRSFTLAGAGSEISAVGKVLTQSEFTRLRSKRLSVTNAFHSTLVDPLVPSLVDIGRNLTFNEPQIPIERSTDFQWPADASGKEGLRTTFWPHHRCQTYEYKPILLPPYQFEKPRHWMEMKSSPRNILSVEDSKADRATEEALPLGFFSFVGYQKEDNRASLFRINTETAQYRDMVLGHKIASTAPICPATLIVSMAIEALTSVRLDLSPSRTDWQPQIHQVSNLAPICIGDSRTDTLAFEATGADDLHCARILDVSDADDIIHGARNIYRAFSKVVDYPEPYCGVQRLIGKGDESGGRVVKKASGEEWLDEHQSNSFSQVAGIWVNCMTDCGPDEMYIANGFEKWISTPVPKEEGHVQSSTWDVLARHERVSEKGIYYDKLEEVILGVNYHKVSKRSMGKILAKLTPGLSVASAEPLSNNKEAQHIAIAESNNEVQITVSKPEQTIAVQSQAPTRDVSTPKIDVAGKIRHILADISGLEISEITDDTGLAEIGIDSLMGMELGSEMEGAFKTPLMSDELAAVTTFTELVTHVARVLGVSDDDRDQVSVDSTSTSDERLTDFGSSRSHNANTGVTTPTGTESHDLKTVPLSAFVPSSAGELHLSPLMVFQAFEETKRMTDDLIAEYRCAGYMETVLPKQTQLCIALAVEACAQLGCDVRSAKPDHTLQRIPHAPEHGRLTKWIYKMLENEARFIDMSAIAGLITRTAVAASSKPSGVILADLLTAFPDHEWVNRLAHFAGSRLADVLRVTGLYGNSLLDNLANGQMRDMLTRLVRKLPTPSEGPLKIMELGAGTGGTTKDMVPSLASLDVPIDYTFTDLSGSFAAAARKKYSQQYSFMKFRVHDMEKAPAPELGLQHVEIASNAIHATHNLQQSLSNIRKALRPDGFLLMLETTEPVVDWTDGWRPEIEIQRIIVAQASVQPGFSLTPTPMKFLPPAPIPELTTKAQQEQLDQYVRQYIKDFTMSNPDSKSVGTELPTLI